VASAADEKAAYDVLIAELATQYEVEPALVKAVIRAESDRFAGRVTTRRTRIDATDASRRAQAWCGHLRPQTFAWRTVAAHALDRFENDTALASPRTTREAELWSAAADCLLPRDASLVATVAALSRSYRKGGKLRRSSIVRAARPPGRLAAARGNHLVRRGGCLGRPALRAGFTLPSVPRAEPTALRHP